MNLSSIENLSPELRHNREQQPMESTSAQVAPMQCYKQPGLYLFAEDCLETLRSLPDGSIDLLLQDTPFGCTQNEWDVKPNLPVMWPEWERVTKENAAMIFFATQPFASELILSNKKLFRYDLIWNKVNTVGHLNANKMPMRQHEHILLFYKKTPVYNPQKTYSGKTYHAKGRTKNNVGGNNYGFANAVDNRILNSGFNYPKSILEIKKDANSIVIHPTQKPLELISYLIKTYSNESDNVFDGYSGSGTTAVACLKEKRYFIGSEINQEYFDLSVKRLEEIRKQPELFK